MKCYELLLQIPKGKVTTYKALAKRLKSHPRAVAKMLSANKHPDTYPCYKVIRSDRSLGGYTHPKGLQEKVKRLKSDGISLAQGKIPEKHVFSW